MVSYDTSAVSKSRDGVRGVDEDDVSLKDHYDSDLALNIEIHTWNWSARVPRGSRIPLVHPTAPQIEFQSQVNRISSATDSENRLLLSIWRP